MTNVNPTDIKCVVVKFEGIGSCKYIDKFLDINTRYTRSFTQLCDRQATYTCSTVYSIEHF